jgi:hypothetical protein
MVGEIIPESRATSVGIRTESYGAGETVCRVARRHGLTPGMDRLARPGVAPLDPATPDPIIRGLLAGPPKSGDVLPAAERKLWLQLLEGSFKLIYKGAPNDPGSAEDMAAQ